MSSPLLEVKDLQVVVGEENKVLLDGLNLTVNAGETHVLMGHNGAGKSTLGYTIMGSPRYEVTDGEILFKGKELLEETADQRAKDGIFLSFQNPLEVPGVSLRNFIRNAVEQRSGSRIKLWTFKKELEKAMEVLQMDPSYGDRDLNVGFSGGEKKKAEILQLLMLKPSLAILDETDSGLDVDAVRTVSKGVEEYQKDKKGALLIITHSTRILDALSVDYTHVLVNGKIAANGDGSLVDGIYPKGLIGYTEDNEGWLKYDPEQAKSLLAEAGYADGFTMEIAADNSSSDSTLLVIQIVQQYLQQIGINAEIKSYDPASWLDLRKSGDMVGFVSSWTADYNDPDNFIYTFFGTPEKSNVRSLNYFNTDVMSRVAAARGIVDDTERLTEYAALEKQIVEEDAAWVPMFSRSHLFVKGDRVASFTPHWAGYNDTQYINVTLK